jgi:hypothetical protein
MQNLTANNSRNLINVGKTQKLEYLKNHKITNTNGNLKDKNMKENKSNGVNTGSHSNTIIQPNLLAKKRTLEDDKVTSKKNISLILENLDQTKSKKLDIRMVRFLIYIFIILHISNLQ